MSGIGVLEEENANKSLIRIFLLSMNVFISIVVS